MLFLNHLKAKLTLDLCFSYILRRMKVMHIDLSNYPSTPSVHSRYELIQYKPHLLENKRTIHLSSFPSASYHGVDNFIKSSRFIPSMSFLLYDKETSTFIGEIDVERILGIYCLCNVGIVQDYRGLGLSKFMLNELLYKIHPNDIKDLYLVVKRDNDVAINLYSNFGFKFA